MQRKNWRTEGQFVKSWKIDPIKVIKPKIGYWKQINSIRSTLCQIIPDIKIKRGPARALNGDLHSNRKQIVGDCRDDIWAHQEK